MSDTIVMTGDTGTAKFWDCQESERLAHNDPDEAVEAWLDAAWEPSWHKLSADERLAKLPKTVDVVGYKPAIPDMFALADGVVEHFLERLDEEFGDPEDFTTETPAMRAIARTFASEFLKHYEVWRCVQCASVVIDVEKWIRENDPGLLKE